MKSVGQGEGEGNMSDRPQFQRAFPFQDDVLALPVVDLDAASQWYSKCFGMTEVDRRDDPHPTVILERDGAQIGFGCRSHTEVTNGGQRPLQGGVS